MKKKAFVLYAMVFVSVLFFGFSTVMETSAWARAGGSGSSGSRGSRSFSAPRSPSSSPWSSSPSTPRSGQGFSSPGSSPFSGGFSRSPFWHGLAGGLAGGFLGNLLFGSRGYGAPMGGSGGGGMGLFDILVLAGIGYLFYKYFWKRRRSQWNDSDYSQPGGFGQGNSDTSRELPQLHPVEGDTQRGIEQIRQLDSTFNESEFKEKAQDIFFRIQASWMNRELDGSQNLLTDEMVKYMNDQFATMKKEGRINRLENIAVRNVEITEAWQETGKDYITVLFTANLLDYTVDDKTNQVVQGDRLNPVKFQEFWTFCRDIGSPQWRLSAINQTT